MAATLEGTEGNLGQLTQVPELCKGSLALLCEMEVRHEQVYQSHDLPKKVLLIFYTRSDQGF